MYDLVAWARTMVTLLSKEFFEKPVRCMEIFEELLHSDEPAQLLLPIMRYDSHLESFSNDSHLVSLSDIAKSYLESPEDFNFDRFAAHIEERAESFIRESKDIFSFNSEKFKHELHDKTKEQLRQLSFINYLDFNFDKYMEFFIEESRNYLGEEFRQFDEFRTLFTSSFDESGHNIDVDSDIYEKNRDFFSLPKNEPISLAAQLEELGQKKGLSFVLKFGSTPAN